MCAEFNVQREVTCVFSHRPTKTGGRRELFVYIYSYDQGAQDASNFETSCSFLWGSSHLRIIPT